MKALVALLVCQLVPGQPFPPAAPLFLAINIDEYISETYAERPRGAAEFIFFTGEPIRYKFVAVNREQPTLILKFPSRVDAAIEIDNETEFDNAPTDMQRPPASLSVTSVSRLVNGHVFPLTDEEVVSLEHHDRIEWRFQLNQRLAPGMYRVPLRFTGQDSEGRRLVMMVHEMRFEVRPASLYPAEVLVREAYYNTGAKRDLGRAETAVRKLMKLHPTSSAARYMLALIENTRGNRELADRYRAQAREIVDKDLDALLNRYCNRQCRASRIEN